jgi:hypothetical protein
MRISLLICLTLITNLVNSQNISFDQAQNLRKQSLANVEAFLTAKGWSMTEAEEATTENMGNATFGFNVDQFDNEKASGWINFYISSIKSSYNRISIQVHKSSLYSTFLTRLTPNGYKLRSTKIEDGAIKKVYANTTTTCVVRTSTSEGTYTKLTSYSFLFLDNLDYQLQYGDE